MSYKSFTRTHMKDHQLQRNIEDIGDDDDGYPRSTTGQVNLLEDFASASDTTLQDSDDPEKASRKRQRRQQRGDRIEFSDDEDGGAVYEKFKRRKTDQRKKTAAHARKVKQKAKENTTMVGKRQTTLIDKKNDRDSRQKFKTNDAFASDSEHETPETSLPQFLKERRTRWNSAQEEYGESVLEKPPDYRDIYFSDDERLEHLKEKPVLPHLDPVAEYKDLDLPYSAGCVPAPIAQWLRDYQREGAAFLHELFVFQKGGILGDDMGLGKTIQVIAFLTAAFGKTGDERDYKRMRKMRRADRWYPKVLIICPGSLMANWKSELDRWGYWHVDLYHGTSVSSREQILKSAQQGRLEIMITTYSTYRLNRGDINLIEWDCVVADECHAIKERSSEITKAMNEVNALCRIGLTGTAIQNKYDEMWTLLNWTNPGRFGSLAGFKTTISEPLKQGQSHDATNAQLSLARRTAERFTQNLLPNFFLRRMKTLIADQLPKKSDRVVFCPLTDAQSDAYANLVDSDKIDYIRRSSEPCDCNSGKKRGWCCYVEIPGGGKWQHHVFSCLNTLTKLTNHLALLCPSSQASRDKQEKEIENLQIALPEQWQDMYRDRDLITNYANTEFCGKWKVLRRLLKFWHSNGDKVLVFGRSVRLLKMLQMLFKSTTSYNVSYLDGSMTYEDRQKTVDDFNANPVQFVFLISTKAGGMGLNITSANKVVIFDPDWNPSWDLQAQDRAYRIGQLRDVEVFRLISAGTVEEIVYARQIYKQQQANIAYNASKERRYFKGVQGTVDKKGEIFGLVNLFSFEGENLVLRDIVNKTNIAESKAGVSVIGLDTSQDAVEQDDEDDDDDIMAKINAEIDGEDAAKKKKKEERKVDPAQAILAKAGVQYTHENSEVIGSSKMETKLSKRAVAAGNDGDLGNEYAFEKSQKQGSLWDGDGDGEVGVEGRKMGFKYRPPVQVRQRIFCEIAKWCGYDDVTEFAVIVEGWTQARRQDCLDGFYRWRGEKYRGEDDQGRDVGEQKELRWESD